MRVAQVESESAADGARRGRWREFEELLGEVESKGRGKLDSETAREVTRLYRRVSSDLLEELRRDDRSETCEYLRALVGRAHGLLHRGTPPKFFAALLRFFAFDFPDTLRRRLRPLLWITFVFALGVGYGAASLSLDGSAREVLLPFGHRYLDPAERVAEEEATPAADIGGKLFATGPVFSGQLFAHNSQVTYLCFALAVTGGIGIVIVVFVNGAYIGAVIADYVARGQTLFLVAWLLPHGVLEIPAILIGATAGMVLAKALFAPGVQGRRRAMEVAGKDSVRLLLGATAMLAVAGAIEGTISQVHEPALPYAAKIAFAVFVAGTFCTYLVLAPRWWRARHPEEATA